MKKMKTIIIVIACVTLLLIAGLFLFKLLNPRGNTNGPIANLNYGGEPIEFEHFKLSKQGMSAEKYVYEASKTENGALLEYYTCYSIWDDKANDYVETKNIVHSINGDKSFYEDLCQLLGNCRINKWDGFSGKNPSGVLDGESMSFVATLADGTSVSSSGSNNFPNNYGTLCSELHNMATHELLSSQQFNNGNYEITLPSSWVNVVSIYYGESYIAFSVKKNDGDDLTFFIIDDDTYGYYPAESYNNVVNVGKLLKEDEQHYITARDSYSLATYVDSLVEQAKVIVDSYETDRQEIINSINGINGYRFVVESEE